MRRPGPTSDGCKRRNNARPSNTYERLKNGNKKARRDSVWGESRRASVSSTGKSRDGN